MKRESFQLTKIAVKGSSVYVEYTDTDGDFYISERRHESPHPDLVKGLQSLSPFVATCTHLAALSALCGWIKGEKEKDFKGILAKAQAMQQEIIDSIDVRSVSIKGDEPEKRAVVISSVLSYRGMSTALNTPRIRLFGSTFGNEIGLSESIDELIEEAYQYLFQGKTAQQKMNFEG
jgi:hypothetical protein